MNIQHLPHVLSPISTGILLFGLILLAAPVGWGAPAPTQNEIYRIAYQEGLKIGHPDTLVAIAYHETRGGLYKFTPHGVVGDSFARFGRRSYGVMQIKIGTAREVLQRYPELGTFPTDEHLLVALLTDHVFNIRVAARYFQMQLERFRHWRTALIAYSAGPDNAKIGRDPQDYVEKIAQTISHQLPKLAFRKPA
jgi:Transglycosylase SLT domain